LRAPPGFNANRWRADLGVGLSGRMLEIRSSSNFFVIGTTPLGNEVDLAFVR
jgi:hypothetical protein